MTRLSQSVAAVSSALATVDLADPAAVEPVLAATLDRRRLDLSDLSPAEQAELVASRAAHVLPNTDALADRIAGHGANGTDFVVKFGIDPTGAEVHLGHAVPMLMLSRLARMGHPVVLIIGDFTAKIGDPSGRSTERPTLTDEQIDANLSTYADQVAPFFDLTRTRLRRNSEWLAEVRLPQLIGVLAHIPVSQALQREDFRTRIAAGSGLAMSEFLYGVVMALDSVEVDAGVEVGGVDQLLNLQMGRTVMDISGQRPQLVLTLPLIEGIDGSGGKMSKSAGNYVALTDPPAEIFGKIMSIPDRLIVSYLRAWTEWADAEIAVLEDRISARTAHPMDAKRLLAGEVVAVLHGLPAAMAARADWDAQFSRRSLADVASLPERSLAAVGAETVAAVLQDLGFTAGTSAARRLAEGRGLKIVAGDQSTALTAADVYRPLADVVGAAVDDVYLRAGKKAARITP